MKKILLLTFLVSFKFLAYGQESSPVYIWPDKVPGETVAKHGPVQTPNREGNVIRLTDVTNPAYYVYKPTAENQNGAGVVVCPGGGYNILAFDKEGTEIAQWLNSLGFTAFVLQYRVPKNQEGALMDIQRTIRTIRSMAQSYGIQSDKLGVIGFSAGGSLSARAATLSSVKSYTPIDKVDSLSSLPNFAMLIYPAYLDLGKGRTLTPELIIDHHTPPMFLFATADDTYSNSVLVMATALRDAKIPVELHLMNKGGHGYGLRPGNIAAESWPEFAAKWLKDLFRSK